MTSLRSTFPGRALAPLFIAIFGSGLAAVAAVGLSFLRFGVYTMPGFCTGGPCVTVGPHYDPYIPTFLIAVVIGAAVAPLVAALVPRYWWAGVLCVLGGVGVPGTFWLITAIYAPYPVQSIVVALLSWLLVSGAVLTAIGLVLLQPPRGEVRVLSGPPTQWNGTV